MTEQINLNRIADACEEIAKKGGSGGGDTVSITPTLEEGTKIADFKINNQEGSLYAPQGGGGGGSATDRLLAEVVIPANTSSEGTDELFASLCSAVANMSAEEFKLSKLTFETTDSNNLHDLYELNPELYEFSDEDGNFIYTMYSLTSALPLEVDSWGINIGGDPADDTHVQVDFIINEMLTDSDTHAVTAQSRQYGTGNGETLDGTIFENYGIAQFTFKLTTLAPATDDSSEDDQNNGVS